MEKNKRGIKLITLVIVLILLVVIEGFYIKKLKTKDKVSVVENDTNNILENTQENEVSEISNGFNDLMVEYILDSIQAYAENGYILKSTTGDADSEKLSKNEAIEKREEYKEKINILLNDENYFGKSFKENNIEKCIYNFEKILNNLELGTNQGIGIGCYDDNGNKLYVYGINVIDMMSPTNTNIVRYFGYDMNFMINDILDSIEKYSESGNILKITTEDTTLENLSIEEAKANREIYKNKIIDILNYKDIFVKIIFENGKLKVNYNLKKVLNSLELEGNMYTETAENEEKIFEF